MYRICLLLVLFAHPLFSEEMYVLTAPGSGKHWLCYCLCEMTGRELVVNRGINQYNSFKALQKGFDRGKIYAANNPKALWLLRENVNQDILITIVRNYREMFIRKYHETDDVILELIRQEQSNDFDSRKYGCYTSPYNHYFNNLRCFDKWNEENRYMVYYEDFMDQPQETLVKLAEFLREHIDPERVEPFISNIEQHAAKCLEIFSRKSETTKKPEGLLDYSLEIGSQDCVKIDTIVESLFSYYFTKYLSRYEWKEPPQ